MTLNTRKRGWGKIADSKSKIAEGRVIEDDDESEREDD